MKTSSKATLLGSQSGMSIIEMLVALGIFSFLLLVSADSFWQSSKALQNQETVVARNRVLQNLIYIIGTPASIRSSLENAASGSPIWTCVYGKPCTTGTIQDLVVYLPPVGVDGNKVVTSGAITGTPTKPMLYNLRGEICDPSAGPCDASEFPISVSTQFDAICPPMYDYKKGVWPSSKPINPDGLQIPTTCEYAHYLKVFYRFEPAAGSPPELSFPPVTGSLYVNAVKIRLNR